jgi:hypothetical protein
MTKRGRTEELKLVFTLNEASDSAELILGANTAKIQPRTGSIAPIDALNLLIVVEGWVVDVEYNHWQNAKDPLEYEVAGRDFSQLPTKSNGLPPPLTQMEIDISRNPGRWLLRHGYVEAVGSVMWLSNLFWNRTGRDRSDGVHSAEWLSTSEPSKGIVEIRSSEHCFISEDTADVKNRLRDVLYA